MGSSFIHLIRTDSNVFFFYYYFLNSPKFVIIIWISSLQFLNNSLAGETVKINPSSTHTHLPFCKRKRALHALKLHLENLTDTFGCHSITHFLLSFCQQNLHFYQSNVIKFLNNGIMPFLQRYPYHNPWKIWMLP